MNMPGKPAQELIELQETVVAHSQNGDQVSNGLPGVVGKEDLSVLVHLNVSGRSIIVSKALLERMPYSRLCDEEDLKSHYKEELKASFYDRCPVLFDIILNIYRTGHISMPADTSMEMIQNELNYWRIDIDVEEVTKTDDERDLDADFDNYDLNLKPLTEDSTSWQRTCYAAWGFFTDPYGPYCTMTALSLVYAALITIVLLLYMIFNGMGTSLAYREDDQFSPMPFRDNNSALLCTTKINCFMASREITWIRTALLILRIMLAIDTVLRMTFCPSKKMFFNSFINWCDIIATLCAIVSIILNFVDSGYVSSDYNDGLGLAYAQVILEILQLMRIFRVFQYIKVMDGLLVLILTLRASYRELFVLFTSLILGMFMFSMLAAYLDMEAPIDEGIPDALYGYWWAIITMTTVGYGDYYPVTVFGYIVGILTALTGLMFTALPVAVIGNNFSIYWEHMKKRKARKMANWKKVHPKESKKSASEKDV